MTPLQYALFKAASSKSGRKIITGILVFVLAAILFLFVAVAALLGVLSVLSRGNELYYPLINSSRITEPFDPDRIIIHKYEVEVEKEIQVEVERPLLDSSGKPLLDAAGRPITHLVVETQTVTVIEEREERIESPHLGVDFNAREGSYVVACCGGVVTRVYSDEEEGNVVEIEHSEAHCTTRYLHLENLLVAVGDELVMGQPIGKVGLSGECTPYRDSTANVHLEILDERGEPQNPAGILKAWGNYLDIPTALVKEVAGAEWADWMVSEILPGDIVWNGEAYMWPVPGWTNLSSGFGYRDLDHDGEKENFHSGLDIPAPAGTPIYAAAPGVVSTKAHWSYGVCVKISVDGQTVNVYGHMQSRAEGIADGVMVETGQLLGYVGSTGNSTGNHLHFEVDVGGRAVDPTPYFGS